MAISTIVDISRLDTGNVLAPERYDPRRHNVQEVGRRLSEVVKVVREQTSSKTAAISRQYLVLATGDAQNGIVRVTKPPGDASNIGSAKNRIHPGQVIISRLRPYLKQVAWLDPGLVEWESGQTDLLCSSEFYVLESLDGDSIAFLVPFLLSEPVQSILAASQEGGHHPRFNERALKSLTIPTSLLERRKELSAKVEGAVNLGRKAFIEIEESIQEAHAAPV